MKLKKLRGSQVERLRMQREKLNQRIHKAEALSKVQTRKQDMRRKILVGSYFLEQAKKNGSLAELKRQMVEFLNRENDKALFEG